MTTPVLVTITAPSCAGKSYLFNYIRDILKLPCLVSTTTRSKRAGEVEGVDYFFISEEESKRLESEDKFAELAIYRGTRYGVTKDEFYSKINTKEKIAFLIVEPSGIDHYVKPALDAGAIHFKVFIDVDIHERIYRLKKRLVDDILAKSTNLERPNPVDLQNSILPHFDRLHAMLTVESNWEDLAKWDLIVDGSELPHNNASKILSQVMNARLKMDLTDN